MGRLRDLVDRRSAHAVRLAYGNEGPWRENLLVDTRWALARRVRPLPPPPSTARAEAAHEVGTTLRRRGWAALPPRDPGLIAAVVNGFDKHIDVDSDGVDMGAAPHDPGVVRYLRRPHELVPEVRLLLDASAVDAVGAYFGTHFRLQHVRMWRIGHLPGETARQRVYGNVWHTDGHRSTGLKIFVQLSDTTEVGGSFRFYDRRETRRVLLPLPGRLTGGPGFDWRLDDLDGHVKLWDAPPGSAVLINTNRLLHRAGVPHPGCTRRMLQFTFDRSAVPTPADLFAGLQEDLNVMPGKTVI